MKNLLILSLLITVFVTPAFAKNIYRHGKQAAPKQDKQSTKKPDRQVMEKISKRVVDKLVVRRKLHKSWTHATLKNTSKKVFRRDPEWVMVYHNKKVMNRNKQKLYIFLSLSGEYLGANFTGN